MLSHESTKVDVKSSMINNNNNVTQRLKTCANFVIYDLCYKICMI